MSEETSQIKIDPGADAGKEPGKDSGKDPGSVPAAESSNAQVSASGEDPIKVPRLGFGENVTEAIKHVKKSVDSQGANVRASDKLSAWLVPATSVALMAAVLCAGWARMAISILCLASLLYYILGRIGIMRTLSERQATLVWHILLGTFLLGIVFTFVYLEIVNRVR
jgi:hypothetical protein